MANIVTRGFGEAGPTIILEGFNSLTIPGTHGGSPIITYGYGYNPLFVVTMGYNSNSIVTPPNAFGLDSVEVRSKECLRVRFTDVPKTISGPSINRGDVAANYQLTGPKTINIIQASPALADPEVIDLYLDKHIIPGNWTLTVASTVKSVTGGSLAPPYVLTFQISEVDQDDINNGGENDDCGDITKYLNPCFRNGKNWKALIAAISYGDCIVRDNSEKALKQLHISTAVGEYLDIRASNVGVERPKNTGISDDKFRQLALSIKNKKLTQSALLDALTVYFGDESTEAFTETEVFEPFTLADGQTLGILVDEEFQAIATFTRADFQILRRAKAIEVAAVINRAFEKFEVNGYAVPHFDATTSQTLVRIYSGTKGLRSSVRVVGGLAQQALQFETNLFPVPGPLPQWTISGLGAGQARLACSLDTFYNFNNVRVGDYVVVNGVEFAGGNRGSFPVLNVNYSFNGGVLNQYIDIQNPNVSSQTIFQISIGSVIIFRPTKKTIYDQPGRVVVSQSNGQTQVSLPTTSEIVNRTNGFAAYGKLNSELSISSIERNVNGLVTVTTNQPHGLTSGMMSVSGFMPDSTSLPVTIGAPTGPYVYNSEVTGTSDTAQVSHINQDTTNGQIWSNSFKDSAGDIWVFGGNKNSGLTAEGHTKIFAVTAETTNGDGSKNYQYRWRKDTTAVNVGVAAEELLSTAYKNQILTAGGFFNGPWSNFASANLARGLVTMKKLTPKSTVAASIQMNNTQGILAAVGFKMLNNPISGDTLVVANGVTTRTYGFGVGGNVTVPIGIQADVTTANLIAAINGDGSAAWKAEAGDVYVSIVENTITTGKSNLCIYGTWATPANAQAYQFGTAFQVQPDYLNPTIVQLPSVNPGFGTAGFHVAITELQTDDFYYVINLGQYRQWDGATWQTLFKWINFNFSLPLPSSTADAAVAQILQNNMIVLTGGYQSEQPHKPSDQIVAIDQTTLIASQIGTLVHPRSMHRMSYLKDDLVFVMGGRQPAIDRTRTSLSFVNWSFDDAFGSLFFDGPVQVNVGGNTRCPGKIGYGVTLNNSPLYGNGTGQAATITKLQGSYTIVGWFTKGTGQIFRNANAFAPVDIHDNTLISFGVDPTDKKFFVRWHKGTNVNVLKKTAATYDQLFTETPIAGRPRYHHVALTMANTNPTCTVTLYIDGNQVDQWTDGCPQNGENGTWRFGDTDAVYSIPGFTGSLDQFGLSTTVCTAVQIREMFLEEVGVAYDAPENLNLMPVGRVLNSCEILNHAGISSLNCPMQFARFAFGMIKLPDSRILVIGGIGYDPSKEFNYHTKSQQQLELSACEIWDPGTNVWTRISDTIEPHSCPAVHYYNNKVYVMGGFKSRLVECLDLETMTWTALYEKMPSVRALGSGAGTKDVLMLSGGGNIANNAIQTPNSDYHVMIGGKVGGQGINGIHKIESASGSTITFKTLNNPNWIHGTSGVATPMKAVSGFIKGPYAFNVKDGVTYGSITATMNQSINRGNSYTTINLGTNGAQGFPKVPGGYIVFGWGYSYQTNPIKYIGRVSNDLIAIDPSYVFDKDIPNGSMVFWTQTKGAYIPGDGKPAFYVTDSSSGRVAAESTLKDISAGGIDLIVDIRYPSDRGLGNAGRPTKNNYKLSDVVEIYGGNDLDRELLERRG